MYELLLDVQFYKNSLNIKNKLFVNRMEVVDMEEFAQTVYEMKKEIRRKDDEIKSLKMKIEELEKLTGQQQIR